MSGFVSCRRSPRSLTLVRHWLGNLPEGSVLADVPGTGEPQEGIAVVEGPRGDVLVVAAARCPWSRCAMPHPGRFSWFRWPLLEQAMEGSRFADFPVCLASFNCSVAGHDL